MASNSLEAVRSFLPEKMLVERRKVGVLWIKKRAALPGGFAYRLEKLLDFALSVSPDDNDVTT